MTCWWWNVKQNWPNVYTTETTSQVYSRTWNGKRMKIRQLFISVCLFILYYFWHFFLTFINNVCMVVLHVKNPKYFSQLYKKLNQTALSSRQRVKQLLAENVWTSKKNLDRINEWDNFSSTNIIRFLTSDWCAAVRIINSFDGKVWNMKDKWGVKINWISSSSVKV